MPSGLLIAVGVIGLIAALTDAASIGHASVKATDCYSEIYCTGELLKTVQLSNIYSDSKTFVDLQQINDPEITLANFYELMKETNNKPTKSQLTQYVNENFVSSNELVNWTLSDWTNNPSILQRIQEPKYYEWAKDLNEIWKKLARKVNPEVARQPDRHSLIYVPNGLIIPGGRFKEFYYWDSYWVIEGLLLSDMYQTARGMIDNFLYMVQKYGFIPNGGRIYYLMRSQPPLIHLMVTVLLWREEMFGGTNPLAKTMVVYDARFETLFRSTALEKFDTAEFLLPNASPSNVFSVSKYLDFTGDYDYLRKVIPTLESEFAFWQQKRMIDVKKNGRTYKMGHYAVNSTRPRPESYREDYEQAQLLPEKSRDFFYNNIKAGAESGWDFSNRWCIADNNRTLSLLNISTQYIIPVDLNAILQQNARLLSEFHNLLGNSAKSQYYHKVASQLQMAIDNVLWNEEEGIWLDYDMKNEKPRHAFYPSNLAPLYTRSYNRLQRERYALSIVKYLKKQGIDTFLGGTPTSLNYTGEQWDFPNAWPPLQSFIVMGLYWTGVQEAVDFAHELAFRWLGSNYAGYVEYKEMFEKYDSLTPGKSGGGGEYNVQSGFGWTNGVVLEFLNTFPNIKVKEISYINDINTEIRQ